MSKPTQIAEQKETRRKLSHLFASFKQSKCQIRPHLFLTGTSGSGKSYLVNEIADELGLGFVEIVTPLHEKHALGMRLITTATHQYIMEQVL